MGYFTLVAGVRQHFKQIKPHPCNRKYLIIFVMDSSVSSTFNKGFLLQKLFPGFVLRICLSVGRTSDPWSCNAVGCYKTEERNPKFYSGSLSGGEIRESESGSCGDFVGKNNPHL